MTRPRLFRFRALCECMPSAQQWISRARQAEQLGYSTLLIRDHFIQEPFGDQLAPLIALMAAADAPTVLRLGSTVLDNDCRHPVMLAKEAATLDVLSNGRIELGLGAGWTKAGYKQAGISFEPAWDRVSQLIEAVRVIKGLLREPPLTFSGTYNTIELIDGYPKPFQQPHPPLLIGASSKRMLSLAAREANLIDLLNGDFTTGVERDDLLNRSPEVLTQKIEWRRQAAGERFDQLELSMVIVPILTQVLLEIAVGVLMGEPTLIGDCHLALGQMSRTNPDKPTLAWITPGLLCFHSHNAIDAHLDFTRLPKMQVMPRLDKELLALRVFAFPLFIWLTPTLRLAVLKQGSIFALRSTFSGNFWWCWSIQFAIAFAAQQCAHLEALTGLQEGVCYIPAIRQQPCVSRQFWQQLLHLLDGGLVALDTTMSEKSAPTTARGWQEHLRRELPADADGPLGMRQVGHRDDAAIWTRLGESLSDTGALNADPHGTLLLRELDTAPTPAHLTNLSIFQSFVHTHPLASKRGRERHLRQPTGGRLAAQRIHQFQERIGTAVKTPIRRLPNLFQYVQVEARKPPLIGLVLCKELYVIWQFLAILGLPFAYRSLNTNSKEGKEKHVRNNTKPEPNYGNHFTTWRVSGKSHFRHLPVTGWIDHRARR